jgi:hypothetical protein
MCGRTALTAAPDDLREVFGLERTPELSPPLQRVPPSQSVAVVRVLRGTPAGARMMDMLRWGLVPGWANDPKVGHKLALAGVWDRWTSRDGEVVDSCAILTQPALPPASEIHDRMPIVLLAEAWDRWLDPAERDVASLLAPVLRGPDVLPSAGTGKDMRARTLAPIALSFSLLAYARSSLATCQTDMDCKGDRVCQAGECVAPPPKPVGAVPILQDDSTSPPAASPAPPARTDAGPVPAAHHEDTRVVQDHPAEESSFPRIWIGVSAAIDLYGIPSANDVCKLNPSGTGPYTSGDAYACLTSSGSPFPGGSQAANNSIKLGDGDQAQGGLQRGPISVSATFDYALTQNVLLGARLGFEALTIPTGSAFAPVRLEARLTYLFGDDALSAKVAPMLLVGAGVGEFDAYVPVNVYATTPGIPPVSMNAWTTAGPAYLVGGAGARFAVTDRVGLSLALKAMGAFGGTAGFLPGFAPEAGVQVGF